MKRIGAFAAILCVAMLAAGFASMTASADGNANLRLYIKGPDVAGVDASQSYEVVVVGADSGAWKYEYYLDGDNLTGASPLKASPNTANVSGTSFTATVTLPSVVGEVSLFVNISSASTTPVLWQTIVKKIDVVKPISLQCQVKNPTQTTLNSIPYQVYVDGSIVDNSTLEVLAAGATVNVSSAWYVKEPSEGEHFVVYRFDVDGDGTYGSNGDLAVSYSFYTKSPGTNYTLLLTSIAAVLTLAVGAILIKRKRFE
jgi:hypothetical protein